jgi:hypothetical protein
MLCEACGERFKAIGPDGLLPHVIAVHPENSLGRWLMREARRL